MIKRIKEILNRSIDNKEISYEYLNKLMKERKAFLIDVRSSQEYEEGHINGAINLPVYNIEKQITKVIPNKNDVVIYALILSLATCGNYIFNIFSVFLFSY